MQKRLFSELGLSEPILKAVAKLGFEQTSPIQSAAIPVLMEGKDVVGQSATGSGKTAAFAIPAIERVEDAGRKVEVLVLVPTRELAVQVAEEVARLAAFRPKVHAVPIYGGASYERQFSELRKGPQIVIGTPGRIIDHLQRNTLDVSHVKMVVLDECDRMLDMGFREDMERILSGTPDERQTVFFSATLPPAIRRLIEDFSREPQHIRIEAQTMTVPTVEQVYYDVPPRAKLDALTRLVDMHDARLGIIFCNTQRTVDDVADALIARGYSADRLHGGMSQVMRTRTLAKFKNSGFDLLVATDVAGRGIDVDDLDLVVNFDLPYDPEDYVHRIGRTGRAGRKGVALTLISGREIYRLQGVERFTRQRMMRGRVPTWDQVEEKRLSGVLDKVRGALEAGRHTAHAASIDRLLDEGHAATDLAAALLSELLAASGLEVEKAPVGDPFARRDGGPPAPAPARPAAKPVERPKEVREAKAPVAPRKEAAVEKAVVEPAPAAPAPAPPKPAPAPAAEPAPAPIAEQQEVAAAAEDAVPAAEAPVKVKKEKKPKAAKISDETADALLAQEEAEARLLAEAVRVPDKAPREPKERRADSARSLPQAASGYRWITFSIGKDAGLTPRDIVDAIAAGGEFPAKAVGLIKLQSDETHVQVQGEFAKDIVESMDGGDFDGRKVRVTLHAGGRSGGKPPFKSGSGAPWDRGPARRPSGGHGHDDRRAGGGGGWGGPRERSDYRGGERREGPPPRRAGGYGGGSGGYGGGAGGGKFGKFPGKPGPKRPRS